MGEQDTQGTETLAECQQERDELQTELEQLQAELRDTQETAARIHHELYLTRQRAEEAQQRIEQLNRDLDRARRQNY